MTPVTVTLPLKLTNPLNGSWGHWSVKARARKAIRHAVALALHGPLADLQYRLACEDADSIETPADDNLARTRLVSYLTQVRLTVTRIAPRSLDRHDGLPASAKPVVDAVADVLRINDADPRLVVSYAQERGAAKQYAVRISVEAR